MRNRKRGAKQAYQMLQNPEHFLTTTLVGTNIAVVAASSLMAFYLKNYVSGFAITAISSLFILIFGEILPKSLARDRATVFTVRVSFFIQLFYYLLYPVIWSVKEFSRLLLKVLGLARESLADFFSRKDLEMLIRMGEQVGLVAKEERGLISRFILRGNHKVREIMVPRTEIVVVKSNKSVHDVSRIFENTGHSRIPVIGKNIDEILGIITAKDILLEKPDTIKQIIRDVLFIPEARIIASLLREMQKKRMNIAIVVDEYGGTAGLVTLEDIVEEYFGEIKDEFDEELSLYGKIEPKKIDVNAKVKIEELNDRIGINLPEGEYQTLGGFIIEKLGRIPKTGENMEFPQYKFTILSATRKKINWVRIIIKNGPSDNRQ